MTNEVVYNTGETERELREKYNYEGSILRQAQKRMLEMLKTLNDICRKNDITYFIVFGTLLGAVRHGGFIPWDDDLDICIDYKKIRKLQRIVNSGNYSFVIQSHENDKGYVRYWYVLRDLGSEYIKDEFQHNQKKYRGLQIDLFPYAFGVSDIGKKLIKKTYHINEKHYLGRNDIISNTIYYATTKLIIPILKFSSKFRGKSIVSVGYEFPKLGSNYPYKDVFPLSQINFEGMQIPCPHKPTNILSIEYGERYSELPDVENREKHKLSNIIFSSSDK